MKYLKFFIAIVLFSFLLVQCTDENTNVLDNIKHDSQTLEVRSQAPNHVVLPPVNCGSEDFVEDIKCGPPTKVIETIVTDSGCEMIVSMEIETCIDEVNNQFFFNFSDLKYEPVSPMSSGCANYWVELLVHDEDYINDELDELEDELADNFQEQWMNNWVIQNEADCSHRYGTSMYFKATCTQRCLTPPTEVGGDFFSYVAPCATDGCCVDIAHYCLQDGVPTKTYESTEMITPCTDFFTVDCGDLLPMGGCRDKGCGD